MKPRDQLIKEIEKLDLWADRGRKEKVISTINTFFKDKVILDKKLFKSFTGFAVGIGILESADTVEKFMKGYNLVKKGDLLTKEEFKAIKFGIEFMDGTYPNIPNYKTPKLRESGLKKLKSLTNRRSG